MTTLEKFAPRVLVQRVRHRLRRQLGIPAPWVRSEMLGREISVREGSLASQSDYDDAWLHACAQHAKIAFDVGANVGQSALLMLLSGSIEQVILIEANKDALAVAADNLIANQLSARARFVPAFASNESDQTIDFWTVGVGAAGSMYRGHALTASAAESHSQVMTLTLDRLAKSFGVVPDFLKIDVEGAEANVLAGSEHIAAQRVSRFLVEMHSPPELPMTENAQLVLDWCSRHRFAAWYLAKAERLTSPAPIAHRGRCHLLLQPDDWAYPDWLSGIAQSAPLPSR